MQRKSNNLHNYKTYLQQTLWLNHSTPWAHLLACDGVNHKNHRNRIQFVVGADFLALTCIIIYLYSQHRDEYNHKHQIMRYKLQILSASKQTTLNQHCNVQEIPTNPLRSLGKNYALHWIAILALSPNISNALTKQMPMHTKCRGTCSYPTFWVRGYWSTKTLPMKCFLARSHEGAFFKCRGRFLPPFLNGQLKETSLFPSKGGGPAYFHPWSTLGNLLPPLKLLYFRTCHPHNIITKQVGHKA